MNSKPTTDPVCGMELGEGEAKQLLVDKGYEYYFCSVGCRAEFERHPDEYVEGVQEVSE